MQVVLAIFTKFNLGIEPVQLWS